MDRLRKAAQRFAEFLDRLTRGPATRGTGGAGAASPAADGSGSPDDMFTRRVAKADSNTGRRIRPEEYGLTAEGLPRSQWDRGTGYHPVMRPSESRDRSIPDHVPRPPVPATSSTVQIPTASAKENEVRTGGIPTPGTASTQSADSSSNNNSVKPGTAIHVTDQ